MEQVELKVSSSTIPSRLKSAIVGYVMDGKVVSLHSIGVPANYVAVKSIILSRGQLQIQGMDLKLVPSFKEVEIINPIDKDTKTAIKWTLTGIQA